MKKIFTLLLLLLITAYGYAQIRIIQVEPSTNTIKIKNFAGSTVDISTYRLCSDIKYTNNLTSGTTIISGSLILTAGSEVELIVPTTVPGSWQDLLSESDLGIYLDASFSSASSMVDFVQWGSGNHGRQSVAVTKGIWTAGEFVSGNEPFSYTGDGSQNGASFWQASSANVAPTDIILDNSIINENLATDALIGSLSSEDEDITDAHSYSLIAGEGDTDNASFNINSNELRASESFNFEDKDTYSIRIQTDDNNGGVFDKSFTIQVADKNDAPTQIALSNQIITENQSIGTLVGSLSTTDEDVGDSHSYTLVDGEGDTDNASFTIEGSGLKTNEVFDIDVKTSYSIRILSSDNNGGSVANTFIIGIIEDLTNTPPTDINLSNNIINENSAIGTSIGFLSSTDANTGDTHQYLIVAGTGDTDNNSFQIIGDVLQTSAVLNFELQETYSVRIQTNDGSGGIYQKALTIIILDINDSPSSILLSNASIQENVSIGTEVGTFITADEDVSDTHTYTLISGDGGDDNASFMVSGSSLKTLASYNFEVKETYSIRLKTEDSEGAKIEQSFSIIVTNVNDSPTGINFTPSQITTTDLIGTLVGCFEVVDEDAIDIHTYTLVSGAGADDNSLFIIQNIDLITNVLLTEITKPILSVRIRATDSGGASTEMTFEIPIEIITSLIKSNNRGNIRSYPNPFDQEISFTLSGKLEGLEVLIYSVQGSLVFHSKSIATIQDKAIVIVEELHSGYYYLKLLHQDKVVLNTVIIKN